MMNATTMMAIIVASININTPIIRRRLLPPAAVNTECKCMSVIKGYRLVNTWLVIIIMIMAMLPMLVV